MRAHTVGSPPRVSSLPRLPSLLTSKGASPLAKCDGHFTLSWLEREGLSGRFAHGAASQIPGDEPGRSAIFCL